MSRTAHYFDCHYGQLHYYKQGTNGNNVPLFCFHMSPYSGKYYEKFQNVLSSDRIVVCPDTPGYGGSTAPSKPISINEIATVMAELINQTDFEQVDVLGFHTGSLVAAEIANILPERIRKLVLPGIPLVPADKRPAIRKNYENPRPYFDDSDFLSTKWSEITDSEKEGWSKDRKIEMFSEVLRAGFKSNWGFLAVFDYDIEARLSMIKKQVLLPVPDEMLAASTRAAASLFENAELKELPYVKSDLFENCPTEFINLVKEFLA